MRYTIDTGAGRIGADDGTTVALWSREGFELLSRLWLQVGWNEKHVYTFSWLGRPIIQLPDDLVRIQEVVHRLQPDVIVECGIAHGGSLIFYASLCRLLGRGRVIGIDVEIRPHNRSAIEEHPLFDLITLVEGSSTDPEVVTRVEGDVAGAETVLVLLDSAHTKAHVRAELEAYAPLVTVGSYVVVMDGIMQLVAGVPRAGERWDVDNPVTAIEEFVAANPSFVVQQPSWEFNESELRENVTHWPSGYLRRIA